MSFLLLMLAFLFTGLAQVSNKALGELGLGGYTGLYTLCFYASGFVLSALVFGVTRHRVAGRDALLGLVMGASGAVMMLLLLRALETVPGVIAFPVRSCGNIALTAAVSTLLWREDVTRAQWLGIGCAVVAIYLLL